MTKLLGVIGDPISHSLSPLIHNGWLRDLGINATYEAMQVADGELSTALATLAKRDVLGVNVTLPHKTAALNAAAIKSDRAIKIGAANTLTYTKGDWAAENTATPGFLEALGAIDSYTDKVVLLGAGGSARALVYALSERGVDTVILNRTRSKAQDLAEMLGSKSTVHGPINQYKEYIDQATIVINTTSMGYSGDIFELPDGQGRLFFDISYGKISAPQLDHAADKGWETRDGLTMLVAQAAFSFEIWFETLPDIERALRRCRLALEAAT